MLPELALCAFWSPNYFTGIENYEMASGTSRKPYALAPAAMCRGLGTYVGGRLIRRCVKVRLPPGAYIQLGVCVCTVAHWFLDPEGRNIQPHVCALPEPKHVSGHGRSNSRTRQLALLFRNLESSGGLCPNCCRVLVIDESTCQTLWTCFLTLGN